jgi:hypothetical protein
MTNSTHRSAPRPRPAALLPGLFAAGLLLSGSLAAQGAAGGAAKPARLFDLGSPLTVTIKAPWRDIERDRKNQDPYPATIEYSDELGNSVALPLTVARRGVKRQEACAFPPIRLRFDKKAAKGTTFRGQESLKMVTHCDRSSYYEQYYMVEMLIYRMYQQLTDYSFRVRPLQVVYFDSERNKPIDEGKFAFLIEDDGDLAKRHDLKKLKIPAISYKQMEPNLASIFSLFQYMIGNVDWAAVRGPDPEECCHNVKLIAKEPRGEGDWIYTIPYDFDSAGMVNAKYAAPPRGLPIRKVTQRLFRGFCWHNDTLDAARDLFREKRDEMMAVLATEERLHSRTRNGVESYLAGFYEIMDDPKKWEKEVLSECRGQPK